MSIDSLKKPSDLDLEVVSEDTTPRTLNFTVPKYRRVQFRKLAAMEDLSLNEMLYKMIDSYQGE